MIYIFDAHNSFCYYTDKPC